LAETPVPSIVAPIALAPVASAPAAGGRRIEAPAAAPAATAALPAAAPADPAASGILAGLAAALAVVLLGLLAVAAAMWAGAARQSRESAGEGPAEAVQAAEGRQHGSLVWQIPAKLAAGSVALAARAGRMIYMVAVVAWTVLEVAAARLLPVARHVAGAAAGAISGRLLPAARAGIATAAAGAAAVTSKLLLPAARQALGKLSGAFSALHRRRAEPSVAQPEAPRYRAPPRKAPFTEEDAVRAVCRAFDRLDEQARTRRVS